MDFTLSKRAKVLSRRLALASRSSRVLGLMCALPREPHPRTDEANILRTSSG